MKKIFVAALLGSLAFQPAHAFTSRGVGMNQCSTWNNGSDWNLKVQYALAWISGAESILKPNITTGTSNISNDDVIRAVTAWCRQNPRADIADALMAAVHAMNP